MSVRGRGVAVNLRRRVERLKVVSATRGDEAAPAVWIVLPAREGEAVTEPKVNGHRVVVPRHWDVSDADAFLTRRSGRPPGKIVFGVDPDRV